MITPTVSYCLLANNDLRWLRVTIPYAMKWADQICLLDMASTDGTKEYCEMMFRPQDRYMRSEVNMCPSKGFGACDNMVVAMADKQWICFMAADTMFLPEVAVRVKDVIAASREPVLASLTRNLKQVPGVTHENVEVLLRNGAFEDHPEHHCRIYDRSVGAEWRGYIHEELFVGEVNAFNNCAQVVDLPRVHFGDWLNSEIRSLRYSWMIREAIRKPELQQWTNAWWFHKYYPEHKEFVDKQAMAYEAHIKNGGAA